MEQVVTDCTLLVAIDNLEKKLSFSFRLTEGHTIFFQLNYPEIVLHYSDSLTHYQGSVQTLFDKKQAFILVRLKPIERQSKQSWNILPFKVNNLLPTLSPLERILFEDSSCNRSLLQMKPMYKKQSVDSAIFQSVWAIVRGGR